MMLLKVSMKGISRFMKQATPSARPAPARPGLTPIILVAAGLGLIALLSVWIKSPLWQAAVLGVVEGLTEFLPISSTGHLLIASRLLGFENSIGGTFEIFIQLGAVLAVVGYFARDLLAQARAVTHDPDTRRFWLSIVIAFLPAAIIGLLLRDWIKQVLFSSPTVIAWSLIIGGIVFLVVEWLPRREVSVRDVQQISLGQALAIGFAQVLALVPGVSRSGSSIVGGMLSGLDRRSSTAFAFYLAIPTLGAATVVDLLGSLDQLSTGDLGRLLVGTIVAMIVAWVSIGWLLRYVANHSFVAFGIYRIIAGIVILLLAAAGVL
jgi:undecaprenyl-diphosphatase